MSNKLVKRTGVFDVFNEFDSLLDGMRQSIWNSPTFLFERNWRPFQFNETGDSVTVDIELPGFKREEITIDVVEDGVLRVSADSKTRGRYTHEFATPKADFDKAEVKLTDGILQITAPVKPVEPPKRKQLTIS